MFFLEKLMTEHNILYFTELKSQRTFKRERGGGGRSTFSSVYFLKLSNTFRNVRVNAAFVSPCLLDFIKVGT